MEADISQSMFKDVNILCKWKHDSSDDEGEMGWGVHVRIK